MLSHGAVHSGAPSPVWQNNLLAGGSRERARHLALELRVALIPHLPQAGGNGIEGAVGGIAECHGDACAVHVAWEQEAGDLGRAAEAHAWQANKVSIFPRRPAGE